MVDLSLELPGRCRTPDPWIPEPLANPPVVSCAAGFEPVVAEELQELGYTACYLKPAKLVVPDASPGACIPLNFYGRTLHRVYLLLGVGAAATLQEVRALAQEVPFQAYLQPEQRFAVRAQRHGTHSSPPWTSPAKSARLWSIACRPTPAAASEPIWKRQMWKSWPS